MNLETLKPITTRENKAEPSNEKLGDLFADATSYFYFCHMPKESYQKVHNFVSEAFIDKSDETALSIAANLFDEDFRLSSEGIEDKRLFSPRFRPSNGYPRLELNPDKVIENIIENGNKVLQDEGRFHDFCSWYRQIEASIEP